MKTKLLAIFVLALAAASISYLAWRFIKRTDEWAFVSCLASICADSARLGDKTPIKLTETEDWKILDESETELLLQTVRRYDCKGAPVENLRDPWGNKVLIAYKHSSTETHFLVWTVGRDGVSGNEDDLVYPFNEKTIPVP